MNTFYIGFCYLMFFLSGAAALIYQVVWVRSLTLVFGGSHLAVTAVLSIFMAGLALGGHVIGKYADAARNPLRLYGYMELGIALFAVIFIGIMKVYPPIYIFMAQGKENSHLYLLLIRMFFSVLALIIPTTLMGGTLPLLTQFISRQPGTVRGYLSFLYGFNTLGAVIGAVSAGFFILRQYSLSSALYTAIIINAIVGIASIALQSGMPAAEEPAPSPGKPADVILPASKKSKKTAYGTVTPGVPSGVMPSVNIILWGIGVSGFCALGYEVLWTRILALFVGATVYGFTTMLAAFLTGIAAGSGTYGIIPRLLKIKDKGVRRSFLWFGIVQIVIGISALLVSVHMWVLPADIVKLTAFFSKKGMDLFGVRAWTGFVLAFLYMLVPAFFMGLAFPLAGKIYAEHKNRVGSAVGDILAYNTVGAILGAAMSGFVLIYLAGIERSLEILIVINIGFGLFTISSLTKRKIAKLLTAAVAGISVLFLIADQSHLRMWDKNYFSVYQSTGPENFDTPEKIESMVKGADLLYYGEGAESIVSSFKAHGGYQYFLTNGRTEASTDSADLQSQFTLGHLPMLLNKNPKDILVVGLGSGMTLGATSIHPGVEHITLAEIEPKVIGVARTFREYNHNVLDNPKLKIVFNDGRNFLMTSKEKYDVITADPIHPWFRGAGYLYTSEYFKIAAEHLKPGGVVCQWVPLYDLTPADIKTIVRTFSGQFKYTMMWVTFGDAELIGSNDPIIPEEAELDRRIADPLINADLKRVRMGSAADFLSYFVMGTQRVHEFGTDGLVNTDNNLYLEFSAPRSMGKASASVGANLQEIFDHREDIMRYLSPDKNPAVWEEQKKRWSLSKAAAVMTDKGQTAFYAGSIDTAEFRDLMTNLSEQYPWYAPAAFLREKYEEAANPGKALSHNMQGIAYGQKGQFDEAIEQFKAAIKLAPGEPAYQRNLERSLALKKEAERKK